MVSNIYAAAHKFTEAHSMRGKMNEQKIKKTPGMSTIEIGNKLHRFYVNDTNHISTKAIYEEIEKMKVEAKAAGFVPDTCFVLHDVDEETKEDLLWYLYILSVACIQVFFFRDQISANFGLNLKNILAEEKNLNATDNIEFASANIIWWLN
jgi:hypothetical protein